MAKRGRRPWRVAHVTLGLDVGGQEKLLVEFARRADRARFELHVIVMGGRGKLAAAIEACGWPVTALNEPPGLRPRLVWRLADHFRRLDCDVVHTHDDKPLMYSVPAARLVGVRRIIHTQHHGKLDILSRRQERVVAWTAHGVDRFVCVSHDSARQMIAQGVPARRVRVLCNGIDLARFRGHGPKPGGPIVTVARLSPEKDIANLLRAMALVSRDDTDARLEIAGDGPVREDLLSLAAELGLGPRVKFLGETNDVPALLARASLFVLPSQAEGISLTLLEAMASGLPVVATRVGGNPEVVNDGRTGWLVPPRDPEALADAIGRLRGDPAGAASMGSAGRSRAEACFDVRHMVARYEALYERRADADLPQATQPLHRREVQPCAS
ncbi:MAG: glycosyltransferase [Gemmataceae bacterium]|nr:glycosyltransferase [Gemmataceae bacterium]